MKKPNHKGKLAFEMLEKEMEGVLVQEMEQLKGGASLGGPNDCVFQSIGFIESKSVQQIQDEYITYYNHAVDVKYGAASGATLHISGNFSGYLGVQEEFVSGFFMQYGLHSGYTSTAPVGQFSSGTQGILLLETSGNSGHAIDILGMESSGVYKTYDPQTCTFGAVSKSDPSIFGTYGR